tara:strand:+ start:82 stop:381 length:300 start_codon:yes stop_codon:yes gene_type:complete
MAKPIKVVIKKSSKPEKKLMAIFSLDNGRTRTTHFGSAGMDDYTKTKDAEQKARYLKRHRRRENWNAPMTAGALSRWVLWNLPSRRASIQAYKNKFNLS